MTTVELRVPEGIWPRRRDWFGRVVQIHKRPGDRVKAGDPIVEIEIEKAVLSIEAGVEGVIKSLEVDVGDRVGPGSLIAVISVGAG